MSVEQKDMIAALLRAHAAVNWAFGALEATNEARPKDTNRLDLGYLAEVVSDISDVLKNAYEVGDTS